MRILAIRGKNLASLAGEFAIDFQAEPLGSAGLFAITGPTGAGKSTLLDALCLALYEKTPAWPRLGANISPTWATTMSCPQTQGRFCGVAPRRAMPRLTLSAATACLTVLAGVCAARVPRLTASFNKARSAFRA